MEVDDNSGALAALQVAGQGEAVAEPSADQGVGGQAAPAPSPHLETTPLTAALDCEVGSESESQLPWGKDGTAGASSDSDFDVPILRLHRHGVLPCVDKSVTAGDRRENEKDLDAPPVCLPPDPSVRAHLLRGAIAQGAQDGGEGGGAGGEDDAEGDQEDDLDSDEDSSDEDSSDRFKKVAVVENKWSLQYLYDLFEGLNFSGDVWQDSVVTFDKVGGLTAHVTRKPSTLLQRYLTWIERADDPKTSFTVYSNSGTLLYVRRCDYGGVQLVRVIGLDEPRDDDWSETMRFTRLFPTMHAVQNSEDGPDNGVFLGRRALRAFWSTLSTVDSSQRENVYHEGDVDFKGDVRELIGVARWYPYGNDKPAPSYFPECKSADMVLVAKAFRLRQQSRKTKAK